MSVLVRFTPASMTAEEYDETVHTLEGEGNSPPDGLDFHTCLGSDGQLRVSEIWDSREQLDTFGKRLVPVLQAQGLDAGQPEVVEIHNIIRR